MIRSYLKIALRNLIANKLYTSINLLGLSVAIAICIVAYVNYEFAADYDGFHENGSQLYMIGSLKQSGDQARSRRAAGCGRASSAWRGSPTAAGSCGMATRYSTKRSC